MTEGLSHYLIINHTIARNSETSILKMISNSGFSLLTGDDCVSIQTGCSNVHVHHINCGPGHGIRYLKQYTKIRKSKRIAIKLI